MGVAIEGETQILLVDTPGIFEPKRRLDRAMVAAAWGGAEGADVIALVVDAKGGLGAKVIDDRREHRRPPRAASILVLNKVDLADKAKLLVHAEKLNARCAFDETFFVSRGDRRRAARAQGGARGARCPRGRGIFPRTRCRDATERALAAEVTREQLYLQLHAELPYAIGGRDRASSTSARTDRSRSTSRSWSSARPSARSCSARAARGSRKSARARGRKLTHLLDRPVHLYLHVKVQGRLGRGPRGLSRHRAGLGRLTCVIPIIRHPRESGPASRR